MPGDSIEYEVTVTNNGNIDAVLNDIKQTKTNQHKDIKFSNNLIGTEVLTADEVIYVGGLYNGDNQNYYLSNDKFTSAIASLMSPWWFVSEAGIDASIVGSGSVVDAQPNFTLDFVVRPVINLACNVEITGGDGTSTNPYVVK